MAAPIRNLTEASTSPPAPPLRASRLSLRARLNLLAALCVVPLLVLTLGGDYVEYRTVRASAEAAAMSQAREFADDVARLLQAELAALQTLALSSDLQASRVDAFRTTGAAFLALRGAPASLRVNDPAGHAALVIGSPGIPPSAAMLHTLFDEGRPIVSGYQEAAFGDRPGIALHVPVTVNGRVIWDLQTTLDLTALVPVMNAQMPPREWGLLIADGAGRTIIRAPSVPPQAGELLPASLRATMHASREGSESGRRADGTRVQRFFATVPGGDWAAADGRWQVVLAIPTIVLRATLYRTVGRALLVGAALLAAGLLLASVMARGIIVPIARLQHLAAVPDEADLRRAPTGLAETDAVADALAAAAAAGRRDALARLQTLAETLEHRVDAEIAAREAAQLEAARAERLRALGQLAGGIAHDVNNVLQTVTLTSQLLAARRTDAAEVARLARRLAHAAQQGMAITGRLLGFTRVQRSPAPEPFELRPLLDELQDMLATMLGAAVTMSVATAPDLPPVLADRGRMETVLINLAVNARDAMPQGGTLHLSATIANVAPPVAVRPGRHILLEMTDTGEGMSPEVLARVTEPFFTTKPAGRGTGLGLSLAHSFAEQSGGALAIESAPGRGTTIRLWLPAAD